MKLSTFIFHVEPSKVNEFSKVVASFFKYYYPDSQKKVTLNISESLLIVKTYKFEWLWCEVSRFVDFVCHRANEEQILVVCASVKF